MRHAEQVAEIAHPSCASRISSSSVRAALVASVACSLAAGQPPEQEAVDRAESEPAGSARRRARRRRGRAARRSWSPRNKDRAAARCAPRSRRSWPASPQRRAGVGGAPVLPDDGVVDGPAGRAVPDHRGLALIGDADARRCLRRRRPPWPWRRARSRPSSPRCPRDRARPGPAPDRSAANSCCAVATGASAASNRIARVEVVPWSMARR